MPEKTREEVRPGSPYVAFSVDPFAWLYLDNPQQRSGLFRVRVPVKTGDRTEAVRERVAKSIGLDDLTRLQIWRHRDAVLGPRQMPAFENYQLDRTELELGVFRVEADQREALSLTADSGEVLSLSTQLVYVVVEAK